LWAGGNSMRRYNWHVRVLFGFRAYRALIFGTIFLEISRVQTQALELRSQLNGEYGCFIPVTDRCNAAPLPRTRFPYAAGSIEP